MAQTRTFDLPVPTSVSDGADKSIENFFRMTVYLRDTGSFIGTAELQVSGDGTNFVPAGGLTLDTPTTFDVVGKKARVSVTAFTSGSATAELTGHDPM